MNSFVCGGCFRVLVREVKKNYAHIERASTRITGRYRVALIIIFARVKTDSSDMETTVTA